MVTKCVLHKGLERAVATAQDGRCKNGLNAPPGVAPGEDHGLRADFSTSRLDNIAPMCSTERVVKLVALALFFLVAGLVHATEENVFRHPLGSQTEAAFRATSQNLSRHPFIRGNFEQERTLSRLNRSLRSSGNFIIAARQGMVWNTLSPFPSTLTMGGDFLIQSRPGGQRTVLSAQGNETFLRMADVISAVFSGDVQRLVDNFEIYYFGTAASWELGLVPMDSAINVFAQRIVMTGDTVIRSIQIMEQNGDTIKYILSNHSFPAELTSDEQEFFSTP